MKLNKISELERPLVWPLIGFALAFFGVIIHGIGFLFESRMVALVGFFIVAAGIVLGIIAVIFAQLKLAYKIISKFFNR